MQIPENLFYSADHEWLRPEENNEATIGITSFAAGELGDIVYVDIAETNTDLTANAVFGTIEAVKTVSDLFLPAPGNIIAINPGLEATPELVNSDPYGAGWLVRIRLAEEFDQNQLLDAPAYRALIGED